MHDAYPVSNIRPLCTYCGWSSILTVLFIKFPSTISWEKVSIPYTCKRSQNQSHTFNICLTEVPLAWLESTSGSCLLNSRFYKLDLRNRVLTQKRGRGRGGWGWITLYVGYIAVIYRYQAFSFSLSSHKNEMLDQASAGSTHHGSWLQYIYCPVVVKWTWNHYLPSNLNFSLQRSYHIRIYCLG